MARDRHSRALDRGADRRAPGRRRECRVGGGRVGDGDPVDGFGRLKPRDDAAGDRHLGVAFAGQHDGDQDLLPQGVGLYQYGYRSYAQQIETYDGSGAKVPLANQFAKPLDGPNLLGGKGGADLQRLAEELKKFDGAGAGEVAEAVDPQLGEHPRVGLVERARSRERPGLPYENGTKKSLL